MNKVNPFKREHKVMRRVSFANVDQAFDVGEGYRRVMQGEITRVTDEVWYGAGIGWKAIGPVEKGRGRTVRYQDIIRRKL